MMTLFPEGGHEGDLPLKVVGSAGAGLRGVDPGVVLGQHAAVTRPPLHVHLLLPHHTRLGLGGGGRGR